ncbi:hypothetical protein GOP47_0006348 [Adiantum capillus-veneris]|uniref:Uncharacterized protein n=1 Tax=Adiantum capillus-veneris TaxID=13818 RepID=A0A9D4V3I5_ADICA|nr:hypothetical protein GOP47_0006348 [Adiantum capillus-veneris]
MALERSLNTRWNRPYEYKLWVCAKYRFLRPFEQGNKEEDDERELANSATWVLLIVLLLRLLWLLVENSSAAKLKLDLQSPSMVLIDADVQKDKFEGKGGWKTLPFIIGNEACERMGSLSVLWNMAPYLMGEYHMTYLRAGYIVNTVSGTCSLTPLLGAYLADSYFGRYNTILGSSFFAFMGLTLLCISATIKSLQPEDCTPSSPQLMYECPQASKSQVWFLMGAFAFMAIGSGGLRSCVYSFGADQFDGSTPEGKRARQSFFNWFYFCSCLSLLCGLTVIVYIQNDISWAIGYLVLALSMVLSVVVFLAGTRFYLHLPTDSGPYTAIIQVLTAATSKYHLPLPSDPIELHNSSTNNMKDGGPLFKHTTRLRWLDKAAIVEARDDVEGKGGGEANKGSWRLCSVQRVEECKTFLNLLPIWGCAILLSVVQAQLGLFTVIQGTFVDPHLGHLKIAPASLFVVTLATFIIVIPMYDILIVPMARHFTKNPRGFSLLQRIGIGIVGFALTMIVAGQVEHKRLIAFNVHGELLGVKWLLLQCVIIGVSDTFAAIGQFEFFYEELPRGMKSMAGAFFWSSNALGSYIGNLVVYVVTKTTSKQNKSWLPQNINEGHLDFFYYLMAGISMLGLVLFIVCSLRYKHVEYLEDEPSTRDP